MKPFVVTSDYIGPYHRRDVSRDGADGIPLIDVPNTLKTRAMGERVVSPTLKRSARSCMRSTISGSSDILSDHFLVGMILSAYQKAI